ncbi:glycosyltransferase involved in cell wall biosynthesis [Natronocella acetinitrilica]|uniref:Glycosyltransferase involved in cell wall biosynthesis n=1 Tax=Natronocella acetinitrilica TaxID=414046 RepID=A0AAE3KD33_9GAMM|nr:glycosyltransferase [Natronocella acetinitrilica]MCP1675783.1 glycosyltransferase involved in cell wall biosynthesis [Natronocella acetinitrilica]
MMMSRSAEGRGLSVVIVVTSRYDDTETVYGAYRDSLQRLGRRLEFIYVLDGPFDAVKQCLRKLQQHGEPIRIIQLNRVFGEAAALSAAFRHVSEDTILILPAFQQVETDDLPEIVDALRDCDVVTARRWPRTDSAFNRLQTNLFAGLVRFFTRTGFRDLGCNVRALRRRVADEVVLYGDQHRFLPILALNQGFRVVERDLRQSRSEQAVRVSAPGTCFRRVIDLLTVFFITKFIRRPMRFYGLTGTATAGLGGAYMAFLVFQKLVLDMPLADRPALLLAALLVVLGAQIFFMGLLGELIIYARARELPDYAIDVVIEGGEPIEASSDPASDTVMTAMARLKRSAPPG